MVLPAPHRVVLDTNVMVRGLINGQCPSGRIVYACENRRLIPILSKTVMAEYARILSSPELHERYPKLEPRRIQTAIERMKYVGDVVKRVARFEFPRDPKDAPFLALCIAGGASHLVTMDHDMLDLVSGHDDAAKRLRRRMPGLQIVDPETFVSQHRHLL